MTDCLDCGACCKFVLIKGNCKGDDRKLWEMRGAQFIDGFIVIPSRCERQDGNKCKYYDRRPQRCRDFEKGGEECQICQKAILAKCTESQSTE